MIEVSREDFDRLRKANMIDFNKMDKNYRITGRKKSGNRKKYYVVEEKRILNFLGRQKEF